MPQAAANTASLESWLTLEASAEARSVGEVPGGFRVDLSYRGSVSADGAENRFAKHVQKGESKRLADLIGHDWLMVSRNGVTDFDARFTFKPSKGLAIGGHIQGRADLRDVLNADGTRFFGDKQDGAQDRNKDGQDAYRAWQRGFPEGKSLPLVLPITFEVASPADENHLAGGIGEANAADVAEAAAAFAELGRALFIAIGAAHFSPGGHSNIRNLTLSVYRVTGAPKSWSSKGTS